MVDPLEIAKMKKKFVTMAGAVIGATLLLGLSAQADDAALLENARTVAGAVPPKLLDVLNQEIAKDGVVSAIGVCNEKAPQMARNASEQTGWAIRRVSLRNRNPKAVPDNWERAGLEDFDRRAAAGEALSGLEKFGVVEADGRKEYRYMKALPVQRVCVACHGPAASIKPEVAEKIKALYPDDKGVGYELGQIRGAITIRKAM
jgi:mono/diheme cytochrome c family protein